MAVIALEPELYQRVSEIAQERQASADEVLNEAVRQFLWELDRRKVSEESQRYRQQHSQIKSQYLGQYIAMRDGHVIDHDTDFTALRQRLRQRLGHVPVMMTRVEETVESSLTRHGFRMEHID